jgi:hypothetical protein
MDHIGLQPEWKTPSQELTDLCRTPIVDKHPV